jgi:xanthine dehydrogenase YagS FAD-binding subunit
MRAFAYSSAHTIDEAMTLLAGEQSRALAGGTDLLTLMKADIDAPALLVDIKQVDALSSRIEETVEGLVLGALCTLSDIARHPAVRERYTALAEAAEAAATPQLRNMATLGGNLLQRPRCWYFRHPSVQCWLKGGEHCPARDGENRQHALFGAGPCYAVHPSDPASALVALDAEVLLRGPAGERTVPLTTFFALPEDERRTETALAQGELIVAVRIPPYPLGTRSTYLKAMDRKFWAFALTGVAVAARLSGNRVQHARIVLGGVAPVPWRARAAEHVLAGEDIGEGLFDRVADAALQGAVPLRHNAYKLQLSRALLRRALQALTGQN